MLDYYVRRYINYYSGPTPRRYLLDATVYRERTANHAIRIAKNEHSFIRTLNTAKSVSEGRDIDYGIECVYTKEGLHSRFHYDHGIDLHVERGDYHA